MALATAPHCVITIPIGPPQGKKIFPRGAESDTMVRSESMLRPVSPCMTQPPAQS